MLATPILAVLFQRGAFSAADTAATAAALAAYAAGLPAFVLVKVLAPGFFARHDTATPVKVAVAAMAANLCLTLVLMQFLAHVGIALATTVAGWVNALTLLGLLIRRGHFRFDSARPAQPAAGRRSPPSAWVSCWRCCGSLSTRRLAGPPLRSHRRARWRWLLRGSPPLRFWRSPSGSPIGASSWGGCAGNRLDRAPRRGDNRRRHASPDEVK